MWSIFICIYLFIINWFKTSEVVHRFKNLCIYVCMYVCMYLFIYLFIYLLIHSFIHSLVRSFVRSSVFYHSAEVIIFLGLSSLFFRQQRRLLIVVKSRKTPHVVLKTVRKKAKSELLWQLPPFSTFPLFSSSSYALCFYFTRFLNYFFHFMFFQRNRNSKDRITLGF